MGWLTTAAIIVGGIVDVIAVVVLMRLVWRRRSRKGSTEMRGGEIMPGATEHQRRPGKFTE